MTQPAISNVILLEQFDPSKKKRLKVLPTWFKLSHYAGAEMLGVSDWYTELQTRAELRETWRSTGKLKAHGFLKSLRSQSQTWQWETIQTHGLLTRGLKELCSQPVLAERKQPILFRNPYKGLEPIKDILLLSSICTLTNRLAYGFFWFAPDREAIAKKLSVFWGSRSGQVSQGKFAQLMNWLFSRYADNERSNVFFDEGGWHAYIDVDLGASDEQLKKDFSAWLDYERAYRNRSAAKKNFTAADFADWHESLVLPYMDLMFWAEMEGERFNEYHLAEALFNADKQCECAPQGKLKTTKKKVEFVLSSAVLDALRREEKWVS